MRIGILGYGNLARTFVAGLKRANPAALSSIGITARSSETMALAREEGLLVYENNETLLASSDLVILSVTSKALDEIEQSGFTVGDVPLISFIAGVTIPSIQKKLGATAVCRIIPNVAMRVCASVSTIQWGEHFPDRMRESVRALFHEVGIVVEAGEAELDVVTSLSSSGIAFAARLIETFEKKGIEMGLPPSESIRIAAGTFDGAIRLMQEGMSAQELVAKVATKGGSTYEGIVSMEADGADAVTSHAVDAAYEKLMRFKQGKDLH